MKKIVKESIVIEGVGDKYAEKTFNIPDNEFEKTEKMHAEEQQRKSANGEIFYKKDDVVIIKNPKNLKYFYPNVRGVIIQNGDLFLELMPTSIHNDILNILKSKNLIPQDTTKKWTRFLPEQNKFVTVQRIKNTNVLAIGESNRAIYDINAYNKNINQFNIIIDKAKKKCKDIEFSNKIIGTLSSTESKGDNFVKKQ